MVKVAVKVDAEGNYSFAGYPDENGVVTASSLEQIISDAKTVYGEDAEVVTE